MWLVKASVNSYEFKEKISNIACKKVDELEDWIEDKKVCKSLCWENSENWAIFQCDIYAAQQKNNLLVKACYLLLEAVMLIAALRMKIEYWTVFNAKG